MFRWFKPAPGLPLPVGGLVALLNGMRLRVTQFGESILKEKGAPVTTFGPELKQLAEDMVETMHAEEGIGLAAQQIGQALQFFVMDLAMPESDADFDWRYDGRKLPLDLIFPLAVVNPQIEIVPPGTPAEAEEGCLSFPGIRGAIERPEAIVLGFQDVEGNAHVLECNGLCARCVQHEYDHNQGVLFTERMGPATVKQLEPKLKKLKRQTRDFLKSGGAA
ncbi:MAG: peptide deformylase [Opitutales bacterium]